MLSGVLAATAMAAQCHTITTVNTIDIHPGMEAQSRAYYRQGWRAARQIALERGLIAGYEMLITSQKSDQPEVVLITRYANDQQYAAREENFIAIFEEIGLDGPITIDGLSRSEMLGPTKGAEDYRVFYSDTGTCPIPGHSESN